MNLTHIDWAILVLFVSILCLIALYVKKFNRSVADFLVANRCGGRYLLGISEGSAAIGAISIIAYFEMYYKAGFTAAWWLIAMSPIGLFLALSGWVIYRYRETRVMTMAEFFEIRYSRNFRVFCGIIAWAAGVINMGIFPAVTARFFIYFCGLPQNYNLFDIEFSTFATIMIIELSLALFFTFTGGMIVVMIADFITGVFCNITFLIILVVLYLNFDWQQIVTALQKAPENESMLNPFKTSEAVGFNPAYFMMLAFYNLYAFKAWQGSQGYNGAAKNAHEAKMAGIIGAWRGIVFLFIIMMLPICAFTLLNNTDFAHSANAAHEVLNNITDKQAQMQMITPIALTQILPIGILGLFVAAMLTAAISTDDTYLHSWGSIFIQDVILPFRKKRLGPKTHMWLLRFSIFFVAAFIFLWSLFFKQTEYIFMYFALTGAIYVGGGGAAIIGGLYWKRGSTNAAWCAMIIGGGIASIGLFIQGLWIKFQPLLLGIFPNWSFLTENTEKFPYNGMHINFFAICCAITVYIIISLIDWLFYRKPAHNMDCLLHRNKYALQGEHEKDLAKPDTGFRALLPGKEFSLRDKILYLSFTIWTVGWLIFFIVVCIYNILYGTSTDFWIRFWPVYIWITGIATFITIIWFISGGIKDALYLFKTLNSAKRNVLDDGRITNRNRIDDADTNN